MITKYAYVDEFGAFGYNFENEGCSTHFIVTAIIVDENDVGTYIDKCANLKAMITVSDNDAANTLVNWLGSGDDANGMEMVNNFCQAHGYTETSMGRLLLHSKENGDI